MRTLRLTLFAVLAALPMGAQISPASNFAPPGYFHTNIELAAGPALGKPTGTFPAAIKHAYGIDQIAGDGTGQVIGIVDAYDYPKAEADLGVFSTQFALPACTTANGCFDLVYASGTEPTGDAGWATEMALDIQWAHAIAPGAKIMLVEAASNSFQDLFTAVVVAARKGATVISMSWSGGELSIETQVDAVFKHAGVAYFAASGDGGNSAMPQYPAASPNVVGVGGTTLHLNSDNTIQSETAWSGSGGGISVYETEPSFQSTYQSSGQRGIPDVAYDADPATGFPIYDTYIAFGWQEVGGTSDATPQWAAMTAIADQLRVAAGKSTLTSADLRLYHMGQGVFHDITAGNNGSCGATCNAGPGYDFVTGLGSPQANLIIPGLVAQP